MMRKLHVGVIDLVTKAPTRSLWARVMGPNFASIMPQVVATWCEQEGHDVTFVCYTGFEDLLVEVPGDADLVFVTAFTHAAQTAYALSNYLRTRGVVTVLGGPHARSYPEDAVKYFDYVLGFTDRSLIRDLLAEPSVQRPTGLHLTASGQPASLPSVRERWKFIERTLEKAPLLKVVNMLGSLGCPYTCSFCVDSVVPYQPLDFEAITEDLRFLLTRFERPKVGWHDPNFGVRFGQYLDAIEAAAPPGSFDFFAESSLSLLSEERLKRLKRAGFKAILPGIESWFDLGNKSKTRKVVGMEKVRRVAEQVNLVLEYVPYVQANFVFSLDMEEGPEPFECTKAFVDAVPGAYPAYCQLSAFGRSAPMNLEYQRQNRVLPFPFHFLDTQYAMNVRPRNYTWPEFYRYMSDLTRHTFSARAIARRCRANERRWGWINLLRGVSGQGRGRVRFYNQLLDRLETDREVRDFFEQETTEIPGFYVDLVRTQLGDLWEWLPGGALRHDPNAYLESAAEAGNGGDPGDRRAALQTVPDP